MSTAVINAMLLSSFAKVDFFFASVYFEKGSKGYSEKPFFLKYRIQINL